MDEYWGFCVGSTFQIRGQMGGLSYELDCFRILDLSMQHFKQMNEQRNQKPPTNNWGGHHLSLNSE